MRKLLVLALVGLLAQLVDGALGMAYGVTRPRCCWSPGRHPASASASVHLAEIGTTLAAGVVALAVRQRRLAGGRPDRGPRRDRRVRRRHLPQLDLHRGGRAVDGGHPARPRRATCCCASPGRCATRKAAGAAAQPVPRPARPGRRLHRLDRWRRLGPGRDAVPAGLRPDGAAQGDRLGGHRRVRGRRRGERRLPDRPGQRGLRAADRRRAAGRWPDRRAASPPSWCASCRRRCSAPRSAASSC